jgi:hypothetical protein
MTSREVKQEMREGMVVWTSIFTGDLQTACPARKLMPSWVKPILR